MSGMRRFHAWRNDLEPNSFGRFYQSRFSLAVGLGCAVYRRVQFQVASQNLLLAPRRAIRWPRIVCQRRNTAKTTRLRAVESKKAGHAALGCFGSARGYSSLLSC